MNKDISLQDYLRFLRKQKGYSQEFVADNLHISRQTYSHYETGRIIPPTNSLYNIARLYGEPIENLLEKAVTYRIGDELTTSGYYLSEESVDDLDDYRNFIESKENNKKYRLLEQSERLLLYYYSCLDLRDQKDILSFMKVKKLNRKNEADGK